MDNTELIRIFDIAGKSLISMFNEIEELEKKYGKNAKWLEKKRQNVQALAEFYDSVRQKLAFYEDILKLMATNYSTMELIHWKSEMNINHRQFAQLLGFENIEKWQKIDSLDAKLKAIHGIISENNS